MSLYDLVEDVRNEHKLRAQFKTPELGPISYCALELAGETGEAVDVVKKAVRNGCFTVSQDEALLYELGDVLWALVSMCEAHGTTLEQIALMNQEKLKARRLEKAK